MTWRFLVDEDTDTDTADEPVDHGYDVVTVPEKLGTGESDDRIIEEAQAADRILITTDRDFLDTGLRADVTVFLVADDTASGDEIAERAAELARLAASPDDLKDVTWL